MKRQSRTSGALLLLILFLHAGALYAQSLTKTRAEWFVDARFGMFIHWGVYSGAEGVWKGEKLRNANDYAEWIYYRNRIDREEYLTLLERFDWEKIDPEEWVLLAKASGMKYVTLTAKHHDGFALWDSQVSGYDITDHTEKRRDIVKELADACRKHGLKLGLYYSHWVDWEHPYGWDHTREIYPITAEQYDQYWQQKVMPQMRELLTQYGDIGLIWFDMWIHHSETIVTRDQLTQLKNMIRELQPDCLVNSRLGLSIEEDPDVDFRTLGDNQLGDTKLDYPWQSPGTVAHSWGYNRLDTDWKSTTHLLQALIGNVSLNGNYMLNIGPAADGSVPYEIRQRMLEMGKWLERNGESIYGAGAFDLPKDQHDWGRITYRETNQGKHRLYLHLYNWPFNDKLPVTGIKRQPEKAWILGDTAEQALQVEQSGVFTRIHLPDSSPDPYISVVVLEYATYPESTQDLVARTIDGGYSLTPGNSLDPRSGTEIEGYSRRGTVPPHVVIEDRYSAEWKIYVDQPGTYRVDISYSYQGEAPAGMIEITLGDSRLEHTVTPTGLTVGEPNRNWHIDNFKSFSAGEMRLQEAGIYEIRMETRAEREPLKFQWVWISPK